MYVVQIAYTILDYIKHSLLNELYIGVIGK